MGIPNILFVSIDTLRADHVSSYGYKKRTTPNIDRLAEESLIYRRNFSTGVWTPPGHASMLTGLYVSQHGVYDNHKLKDHIPTIATFLKSRGYQTAGFVNNSQVGELVGLDKGHDVFIEVWKGVKPRNMVERALRGTARKIKEKLGRSDMGAHRTNEFFKAWIESTIDKKAPFYCFIHYIEAHNPLRPPVPFKRQFLPSSCKHMELAKLKRIANNPLICLVEEMNVNDRETEYLKSLYNGEIAYVDQKVGELIEILKRNGLYENTMIIITADHGEHFGEHGLWSHVASLYREIVEVPLIIKFPREYGYVGEVDAITQLVDIFPTVEDLVGESHKVQRSGTSLFQKEELSSFREYAFAEWEGRVPYFILDQMKQGKGCPLLDTIKLRMSMIQSKEFKYILRFDGHEEFYDLKNDPGETSSNIDEGSIFMAMRDEMARRTKYSQISQDAEDIELNEEVKKNLRALGYL